MQGDSWPLLASVPASQNCPGASPSVLRRCRTVPPVSSTLLNFRSARSIQNQGRVKTIVDWVIGNITNFRPRPRPNGDRAHLQLCTTSSLVRSCICIALDVYVFTVHSLCCNCMHSTVRHLHIGTIIKLQSVEKFDVFSHQPQTDFTDFWLFFTCSAVSFSSHSLIFLPKRHYVSFGSLLSQIRLSVVCNVVRLTYQFETFGNISSPLCTVAILRPPCKILRRSSQGNPSVWSIKRKSGSKIERCHVR